MTNVIRAKDYEQSLRDSKTLRLSLVIQEIEFIQQEIHHLNKKIRGYEKEVRDLKAELAKGVRS